MSHRRSFLSGLAAGFLGLFTSRASAGGGPCRDYVPTGCGGRPLHGATKPVAKTEEQDDDPHGVKTQVFGVVMGGAIPCSLFDGHAVLKEVRYATPEEIREYEGLWGREPSLVTHMVRVTEDGRKDVFRVHHEYQVGTLDELVAQYRLQLEAAFNKALITSGGAAELPELRAKVREQGQTAVDRLRHEQLLSAETPEESIFNPAVTVPVK